LEEVFSLSKSCFVFDRHTERRVGGISNLEAISEAKRFHIYPKFDTQAALTVQSVSNNKFQDFVKGKAS
jgi:hypothetical protein